jgi:succinyl-CoA synthetase beta subunit
MLLDEWQGKCLLRSAGIAVPKGRLISAPDEARDLRLAFPVAVKAQLARGGRGKAGGVIKAADADAARAAAVRLLDTEFSGERPDHVLVEEWQPAARELYLSVTIDGEADGYSVLYSPAGGIDVETSRPAARYPVGHPDAFRGHEFRRVVSGVDDDATVRERIVALARRLLRLARARDCLTIEINPLIMTAEGALVAADAKVVCDTAAAFRAADVQRLVRASREREDEWCRRCLEADLMLVRLKGDVGLISGGAGMTMAVMDLIERAGGRPACFLDCSANPTPTGYRLAFSLLDHASEVRAILVSVFGGATQMERVARVMTDIMAERRAGKPVVFRLNGTNADEASAILREAGLVNHATLEEAVSNVVEAVKAAA